MNHYRRSILYSLISVGTVAVAGCSETDKADNNESLSNGDSQDDSQNEEQLSIGESVTHGGIEVSVTEAETARQLTTSDGPDMGQQRDVITPQSGAVFALAHIQVENVGESEVIYPDRVRDIEMVYQDGILDEEFVTGPLGIENRQEPAYSDNLEENNADTGAFPGIVVRGWMVFEVPENFDQSEAAIRISHAAETFSWQYEAQGPPVSTPRPPPPEPDLWEVTRQVGDPITYEGVRMAVTDYETAPAFTELGDNDENYTADSGLVYLFIQVEITNMRDGRISIPSAGSGSYLSEIVVVRDGREINGVTIENGGRLRFNQSERVAYDGPSNQGDDLVNPEETAEGWLVYSVPENFDPEATRVVITQGSGERNIDFQDFKWVLR